MATRKDQSRAKQPLGNLIAPFVSSMLVLAVNLGVPIDAELQNAILSAIVCGWAVIAGALETYKHHKDV